MALVLALLICLGSGAAVVSAAWPCGMPAAAGIKLPLSLGVGIGIFSVVYFLCRVLGIANLFAADLVVLVFLVVLNFFLRRHGGVVMFPSVPDECPPRWLHKTTIAALTIALCAAMYNAIVRVLAYPHGEGWDAFAIWNLRARFLFRGGENWRDGLAAIIPWSHPDYPLLLPAAIAHFWSYLGRESQIAPAMIALIFTFSTVGLLFSSLRILKGTKIAMLGTLALLATPFFIEQGTSQYADVPLSFFFLGAVALLSIADGLDGNTKTGTLVLAGLSAGFAAWTKNEGLLFLGTLLMSYLLTTVRTRRQQATDGKSDKNQTDWKRPAALIAGTVPAIVLIIWFKHSFAPPGDLLSPSNRIISKLMVASRYWAIIKWYVKDFFRFGHWLSIPGTLLLVGLYFVARQESALLGSRAARLALFLTLAGYFGVYLITPYDIYWHLRFSLDRLFLQLWPSAIFLLCLQLRFAANPTPVPHS